MVENEFNAIDFMKLFGWSKSKEILFVAISKISDLSSINNCMVK